MTASPGPAGMRALLALPQPPDQQAVLAIMRDMRGELECTWASRSSRCHAGAGGGDDAGSGNRQPFGLLHGGASAALAETMGSYHGSLVGGGKAPLGIELSCTHHRAAKDGIVTAVSTPLHVGRTLCTFEIAITDDADRRICTARLTVLLSNVQT